MPVREGGEKIRDIIYGHQYHSIVCVAEIVNF